MTSAAKVIIGTIILTAASIACIFLWPPPVTWQGTADSFHFALSLSTAIAFTHICAAILFLMSLGAYKAKLRFAYAAIVFSITVTALGTLQLPLLDVFGLSNSFWVTSGAIAVPFLLSGLAVYVGARNFARLVGVKTILTRMIVTIPAVIVLLVLTSFLPHPPADRSEIAFDISNAIILWTGLFNLIAAVIIFRVSKHMGAHYTAAANWLFTGLLTAALVIAAVYAPNFIPGMDDQFDALVDIVALTAGLIWIKAGYTFYRTKDY